MCIILILLLNLIHFGSSAENVKEIEKYKEMINRMEETTRQSNLEQLIIDILYTRIRKIKCFALICDTMYCNEFTSKMFKKFKIYATYFLTQVADAEDLFAPYNETIESLDEVKTEGCQFYIILLANGLQLSRFLKFGDRYRLLNTRANFIFLYDIRLFHKDLHYLWTRIVNVIFIREYGGGSKSSNKAVAIPWFDLSTVPFPIPIQGVFIPHRLDTWRKGHFRLGINLFRDKTSDLRSQSLRVVTFQHIPAMFKTINEPADNITTNLDLPRQKTVTYKGLEIEILKTLANQMNFETIIYEPENADFEKWGQKQDGKFSGLLGEMVRFQAEIALGDLYYSPYHLELMDLTIPYNTECLTFLTPESSKDNSWMTLILPFKLYMWLAVIFVICFIGFIFHGLARFHRNLYDYFHERTCIIVETKTLSAEADKYRQKLNSPFKHMQFHQRKIQIVEDEDKPSGLYLFDESFNAFLYTYSMILLVGLPKVPDGWSLRMIVGWYWIYCLLVVVSYKASMTAILANPKPKITIDSLEELQESNIACGGWGENTKEFFLTSLDSAGQKIGEKFEHVNNTETAIERVADGVFAYYENIYYLKAASVKRELKVQSERSKDKTIIDDDRNLHIMSSCVINMPISLGLQKNSPIKPRVDIFIRRVIESGFVKKWLDDVMQPTLTSEIHIDPDETNELMTLQKLYAGIVALFIGYFISSIALGIELCYWHFVVTKHPHFDKYSRTIYTPIKNKKEIFTDS